MMLDDVSAPRSISAWVQDLGSGGSTPLVSRTPHLQLHPVHESPSLLLVEVTRGAPRPKGTMLWLDERGSYEVEVVLRRQTARGMRSFMGLRVAQLPSAA